jgi:hemolysin activation/secretion protein
MLGKMKYWFVVCVVMFGTSFSIGFAQTTPDPSDQLRREQERLEQLQKDNSPASAHQASIDTLARDTATLQDEALCFPIDQIIFDTTEADALSAKAVDFSWALTAANATALGEMDLAEGRCLGIEGISAVVRRVQNAIIEAGFITTRVFLAPQNLTSKKLKLTLVPGRLKDIRFSDPKVLTQMTRAIPRRKDDLLFLRDIEQGLENLKRVPTAEADFQITPSKAPNAGPGDSDLVIDWRQTKPLRFSVSLDNSGSDATGKYQGSTTISWDNPLSLSDLFYISFSNDLGGGMAGPRGSKSASLHYSVPVGYWLASLDVGKSDYDQTVAGASQDYVYSGQADNVSFKLSRILHRDEKSKTQGFISGWARSSKNYIDDTEVEVQRRRTAGWELGVNHTRYVKRATLDFGITLRKGTGAFDAIAAPEDAFGEGSSRPELLKFNASLSSPLQLLGHDLHYNGSFKAQWSNTPLVAQDRFSIGSRYTVRGFTGETTLSAERGWVFRNDIAIGIGQSRQQAYVGFDLGKVSGPSTANLLGDTLAGVAFGIKGKIKEVNYNAYVAKSLHRPQGFGTGDPVFDFSLNWSY